MRDRPSVERAPGGETSLNRLPRDGEMAGLLREVDWTQSPLGPPDAWPRSLQATLSLALGSGFPMFIAWGEKLGFLYNDAYSVILGDKHPAALGRSFKEIWAEIWPDILPLIEAALAGRATSLENLPLVIRRHGFDEEAFFTFSYSPLHDEDGTIRGMFCVCNETTAQVLADRQLRIGEERLQLALSAGRGIGTWDWDVVNDRVTADARFAALYGVDPRKAAEGASIADFFGAVHPGDFSGLQAAVDVALKTGEPFAREYRLVQADGSICWVAAEGRCYLAADDTPVRFPGVTFDISDRKAVEEALRASEARFQGIVNSIDQMIWSTRADGFHDFYNDRWYQFTGTEPGTTDGEGWAAIFHPEDQARAWALWRHSLETGHPYHIEYRLRHHSGAYRWVLGRAQPVRDEKGAISRWFGTCTDIEEIVQARHVLARSREELEVLVEQRTAEVERTHEALRQSQKMEVLGQLTGGVAHDFNNLLQVVMGNLEILQRNLPEDASRLRRSATNAMGGAKRAALLTQRLLAFSRRQPLAPKAVSVNRLVADMSDLLSRTIGEAVQIETVLAAGLWHVEADPNQLESAILNLAINARDAIVDGGRLTIETANVHLDHAHSAAGAGVPPGRYVVIRVTDTGAGMDRETLGKAFEPFFTTKEVGKGTGLGLSQVYGFVKQSGGNVQILSEVGEGSTVKIYLPRLIGEGAEEDVQEPGRALPEGHHRETILVLEDDDEVRAYSVEVLRELGYRTLEARDGPSALHVLEGQSNAVHLLFSDIVLPGGMTGAVVAEKARALLPGLKVLFTTGYARDAIVHHGRLDPGVELLTKPFSYADLAARIREVLDAPA